MDALVSAVDTFLAARGVAKDEPVALECGNTIPGVLALLALFERGATIALLPPSAPSAAPTPLPSFIQQRVRTGGGTAELGGPETFLEVSPNDDARPLPPDSSLRRGRLLLRTSGSIGSPKLVVHTHAALFANAQNAVERLDLQSVDRVCIPVPLAHMYGLGAGLLPSLLVGASVDLIDGANLIRYLDQEQRVRPTVAFLTPNLCRMLVRPRPAPGHYRHVVVAGDKLDPVIFHAAEAIYRRVVNLYGSTEMGVVCAADPREGEGPRSLTVGRPVPGVKLRLEPRPDAEPDDEASELLCAHPFGFEGYVDQDGHPVLEPVLETGALEAGWYWTRDLARMSPEGWLELRGRSDHAVKRDGRLVLLSELERTMGLLPGVDRVATVVTGESKRGRGIVAYFTSLDGATLDPVLLRRSCQEILPPYAVPDAIHILPALPSLPNGKLDRRALLRLSLARTPISEAVTE